MKFDFTPLNNSLLKTESLIYEHAFGSIYLKDMLQRIRENVKDYKGELIKKYLNDLLEADIASIKEDECELIHNFFEEGII